MIEYGGRVAQLVSALVTNAGGSVQIWSWDSDCDYELVVLHY